MATLQMEFIAKQLIISIEPDVDNFDSLSSLAFKVYNYWVKGLSPIGPDRKNQPRFYLLYFICSDDKVKPERPYAFYRAQILEGLVRAWIIYCVSLGLNLRCRS